MKRLFLALGALALLALPAGAVDFPPPAGFVTDTVNLLAPEQKQQIEAELKRYETQTGTEIAILIVADTGGMAAPDYATEIANRWGVGKKNVDNGALVLVAVNSHDFWIAVGRQLEGALTDGESGAIFREVVRPRFRGGDYGGGLIAGVSAMEKAIAGESFTEERMGNGRGAQNSFRMWEFIIFFAIMGLSWLAAILGRSKEVWPGAVLGAGAGGIASWFLSYGLIAILAIAGVSALLGLGFDWVVSRSYKRYSGGGPLPPWWMGGGGFGGGSGGGFGGFGGGGFSGGGGGGRW